MAASSDGRSGIAFTAERAGHELRTADKLDRRRAFDPGDARRKTQEAARARAEGERLLAAPERLIGDASRELVPAPVALEADLSPARQHVLSTLEEPTVISVDASEHRAHAATKAGVLSAALDAAVSAGADNQSRENARAPSRRGPSRGHGVARARGRGWRVRAPSPAGRARAPHQCGRAAL